MAVSNPARLRRHRGPALASPRFRESQGKPAVLLWPCGGCPREREELVAVLDLAAVFGVALAVGGPYRLVGIGLVDRNNLPHAIRELVRQSVFGRAVAFARRGLNDQVAAIEGMRRQAIDVPQAASRALGEMAVPRERNPLRIAGISIAQTVE